LSVVCRPRQVLLSASVHISVWKRLEEQEGRDGSRWSDRTAFTDLCVHGHQQLRPGHGPTQPRRQGMKEPPHVTRCMWSEVAVRRARLVGLMKWVTFRAYKVLVCNQPLWPTHPPNLREVGNGYLSGTVAVVFGWEGNRRPCVTDCAVSTCGLCGPIKANERPV